MSQNQTQSAVRIEPANWQGAYLIGTVLNFFCLAALFGLFLQYISLYGTSDFKLRWVIYFLMIFACLKSAQTLYITWMLNIRYYGLFKESFIWSFGDWLGRSNPLVGAILCAYVQSFFIYRLWAISRKWILVAINVCLSILSVVSASMWTVYISANAENNRNFQVWMELHFSSVFASDVFMSAAISYHLLKAKKDVSPYTVGVLESLLRVTFFTGLPATICALINLIFASQHDFRMIMNVIIVNQPLPFLFAISMLWTVNARARISQCRDAAEAQERVLEPEVVSELVFVTLKGSDESSLESGSVQSRDVAAQ